MSVAAGVFVVVLGVILVRAVWPRANPGARLAAVGGCLFAGWLLVGAVNAASAGKMAGWTLAGFVTDAVGIGHLVGHL